jgi:glutathione S-transferase
MLLEFLQVPYELNHYMDKDSWFNEKFNMGFSFPNLPYLVTKDGFHLSESDAISRYLCDKHDPSLLGISAEEKATITMLHGVYWTLKMAVAMPCYNGSVEREKILPSVKDKLDMISSFLADKKFLMGNDVRYIDFEYCEVFDLIEFISKGIFFKEYPSLKNYYENVLRIPQMVKYRGGETYKKLPFNASFAVVGANYD